MGGLNRSDGKRNQEGASKDKMRGGDSNGNKRGYWRLGDNVGEQKGKRRS